jgi:hypothetical protein
MSNRGRKRIGALASGVAVAALLVVGCGGGKNFADKPRPAAPITLTGVISNKGVTMSPNKVGAGPVVILVSNQTLAPHTLELDGSAIQPVRTNAVAPSDTGRIQTTLTKGVYTVKAGSEKAVARELRPARLIIGAERADSNDEVGLP